MGLPTSLKLEYLPDDDTKVLPEAQTCFGILQLQVVHTKKEDFFDMVNKAIDFGSKGFALLCFKITYLINTCIHCFILCFS
jgi:hypothetical protein